MSDRVHTACTDCGWSRHYTSQAKADYAYRRHSCARWRSIHAAVAAADAREASIDRTPKPCTHGDRHQHGTYTAYTLDACRCLPCSAATSRYNADRARAKAYGTWDGLVDAQPVRDHVAALREAGLGARRIAMAAGLSQTSVGKLIYGHKGRPPSARVKGSTAAAILAVPMPTVDDLGGSVTVDPTGTRRRLECLIALGWSVKRLAETHDLDRQGLDRALAWAPVTATTARTVRAVFEAIGDRRPPEGTRTERQAAVRSRNLAAARGWVVPAEWDDADLDDPYAEPPGAATGCGEYGCSDPVLAKGLCSHHYHQARHHRTTGQRGGVDLDEWLHLVRGGEQTVRAADRLGVTLGGVEAAARRCERDDVLRILAQERAA